MKKLVKFLIPVLMLSSSVAMAADSNPKIAVIDVQKIIQAAPETTKFNAELDKQFKPRQEKLMQMNQALHAEQERFTKDSAVMSAKERDALRNKIVKEDQELQKLGQQYQNEFNEARNKDLQQLYTKLQATVDQIAKQQQFDLILERQAVPYVSTQYDLTDEVIKKLNS